MGEQDRFRVDNVNTGDPDLLVQAGQARDITVQKAGRDQYVETHLYFGVGVQRTRRVEADAGVEVDPYPRGMAALEPEDAEWFFGRDTLLGDVVRRVDERFREGGGPLMVMAPSGAGKSSLLHAGLIPRLEQGAIPGSQHWPGLRLTPTATPIKALAKAITVITGQPAADVERELVERPDRCVEVLAAVVRERSSTVIVANARLMVIVDQLEELFTLCTDDEERRRFLDVLSRLCAPGSAGREPVGLVVFGMRADFYAHCADYPELRESVQDGHVVVGPMSPKELREAILYPAQRAGLRVEPGLVELLLGDLGALGAEDGKDVRPGRYEAGRLPLLAHALRATYLGRHGRTLTVEAYRDTGGIEEAVATTANKAFNRLDPAAREATPGLFLRLIKIGDGTEHTRRRVPRTELLGDNTDQAATTALDAFTSKRLLTQGLDHDTVEITHEALIHAWPRLRDWIDDDRAGNLVRQQLTEAATAWENEGHDRAALYRGARLATAREHTSTPPHNDNLTPTAQHFLRASARHENRATRRRNTVIAALSLLTVLSLIAAYVANTQRNIATANQLTAQADQVLKDNPNGADASLAAQLNLAAYLLNKSDEKIITKLHDAANAPLSSPPISNRGPVPSVAFSRDGRTLASGAGGDGLRLWNVTDPGQVSLLAESPMAESGSVYSLAFSPDGRTLASTSHKGLQLWNVEDPGRLVPLREFQVPDGDIVSSLAFTPDGRTLATGSEGLLQLWNVEDPRKLALLGEYQVPDEDIVSSLAFTPDGRTLATGSEGLLQLWNVEDPVKASPLGEGLADDSVDFDSVVFSPDGRTLAGSSSAGISDRNGMLRLWNVSESGDLSPLGESLTGSVDIDVESVAFSPDGHTLASGGSEGAQLWNVADPSQASPLGDPLTGNSWVNSVSFSPDGKTLAGGSGVGDTNGEVRLWSVPNNLPEGGAVSSLDFSPDGRTLGSGDADGGVRLRKVARSGKLSPLNGPLLGDTRLASVAFSPTGRILASGSSEGMQLWNITDPENITPIGGKLSAGFFPSNSVGSVVFSPDGRTLANLTIGGGLSLWNVADAMDPSRPAEPLFADDSFGDQIAFSSDSRVLAVENDGGLQLWDIVDPKNTSKLGSMTKGGWNNVFSTAFSPGGNILAISGSSGVRLWNISDPNNMFPLGDSLLGGNFVGGIKFSPDGRTLAGIGEDGLRLWDVSDPINSSPLVGPLAGGSEVNTVEFSPDGRKLASGGYSEVGGEGHVVRLYDLDIEQVIDSICDVTQNYLTPELWNRYFPGEEIIGSPCLAR